MDQYIGLGEQTMVAASKNIQAKAGARQPRPPKELTHYTTLTGLEGIIRTKALWASNASFLNDRAELTHALDASQKAIKLLSSQKALKAWGGAIETAFTELRKGLQAQSYVACFCGDNDNLSQWRGYGGAVQGVSLTFDQRALTKRLQKDKATLLNVVYAKLTTASRLKDALEAELRDIAELEELLGPADAEAEQADLLARISRLLPKFKHLGFRDEREWRYVIQRDIAPEDMQFRVLQNKIVPYITIGNSSTNLPILSIKIGPGTDQELTARSVETFMGAQGYDVDVTLSEVPFRP
ncbi:hypothetical protein JP75_10945 [Devosia riboflavina]|uniref:DUF2971 domain-containing protein n=1 Tax=Devosia riboflavina TaxID=46914 RepID=A0A087M2J6_9HYPH|nr:DUF2971 domain-containing protein [Devosia riboflavina]KFL31099.1 hypothetical protein JP75_10945 [Devosia riboflavina]